MHIGSWSMVERDRKTVLRLEWDRYTHTHTHTHTHTFIHTLIHIHIHELPGINPTGKSNRTLLARKCSGRCSNGLVGAIDVSHFTASTSGGGGASMAVALAYNSSFKLGAAVLQKAVYDAGWSLRGVESEMQVEVDFLYINILKSP